MNTQGEALPFFLKTIVFASFVGVEAIILKTL